MLAAASASMSLLRDIFPFMPGDEDIFTTAAISIGPEGEVT